VLVVISSNFSLTYGSARPFGSIGMRFLALTTVGEDEERIAMEFYCASIIVSR